MKLYHGTNYSAAMDICVNGINLKYSQKYLDFGAGFYTTPSYEQAAVTAIRKTSKYNARNKVHEEPYIVELKFLPQKEINLKVAQYPRHGKAWGEFVLNNRLTEPILNEYNILKHNQDAKYDVCFGEIADGEIVNIAYQVNNRKILPKEIDFNKFLNIDGKVYPLQYSFHTKNAISCISVISCAIICNKEKYKELIVKRKKVGRYDKCSNKGI